MLMKLSLIMPMLLSLVGCAAQRPMPIRPVTIQVVDLETKRPLEGVPVFYALQNKVIQKYVFFVIPSIEPEVGSKIVYKSRAMTDSNGEVRFHASNFMLSKNERFDTEMIIVNIDVDMATRAASEMKASLESNYSEGKVRREGPVDNIDLIHWINILGRDTRDKMYIRPHNDYTGAFIWSTAIPPRKNGEVSDWFESEENYTMTFAGDSLDKDQDFIVVFLERISER